MGSRIGSQVLCPHAFFSLDLIIPRQHLNASIASSQLMCLFAPTQHKTPASDLELAPEPISTFTHSIFQLPDAAGYHALALMTRTFHLVLA